MATIEKLEHDKVKVSVSVSKEAFQEALQKAFLKEGKKINIPGFRKGKAPRKVIESVYGEGVFYEEAFDECWGEAYDKVIEENKLEPVDQPKEFDVQKIGREDGVEFTCVVQLKPAVKLGKYKGVEAEKTEFKVTDKDVDNVVNEEREKDARFVEVDRAVEKGDRVIIDYSGSVDGVKFDGGTAEEQPLVIGSNSFIPGFEDQVIGMKKDEEKDINVTFPAEYQQKDLAGKDAVFHIKLHQVQLKELPELDDEFAKDVSEFDTLQEYKDDLRKKMEEDSAKNEKAANENAVVSAVSENAEVEIPECMISRQIDYMMQEMEYRLMMSGINLETYCQWLNITPVQLRANYHEEAKRRVKNQLVLDAIRMEEKIELTKEEQDAAVDEYIKENNIQKENFREELTDDDREYINGGKLVQKTVDFLVANAKFVKKKAEKKEDGKPAAKKTASKKTEETASEKKTAKAPAKKTAAKTTAKKAEDK